MWTLSDFYRSREWRRFREVVLNERMHEDGLIYDEVTGKPIIKAYDIILHHKIELTEENVNDRSISLNPDNIQVVSHRTHNYIHNRLGHAVRQVYLVYGAPLSGKSSWVKENMSEGDLVIDLDSIWQCVSGCPRYVKPNKLKSVVFRVRDGLLDSVKYRLGKWDNAYLIGGYPLQGDRERLCRELGAREIFIDTPEDECLSRLLQDTERNEDEWLHYIRDWFEQYSPPIDV